MPNKLISLLDFNYNFYGNKFASLFSVHLIFTPEWLLTTGQPSKTMPYLF